MDKIRRAALYVRVSTDEQAERGYSLRDQEERLRTWCAREGVDIAGVYVEEGASAKTFERPQWVRLLAVAEAGRVPPFDAVLCVKWDRFSRDATGALGMIRRLDARGIAVQAIEQPIDTSVPEQLLMQVLYVAAPEVENRRRSLATKAGMRRAMAEGRYVNVPPKGYRRGRDAQDRYLIVPGPDAGHVRDAFRLATEKGRTMESIRRELVGRGFRCSKNQFTLLLRNPIYAGRIVIPAWGGEPERDVAGLHEPLVAHGEWARVQRDRFAAADRRRVAHRRLVPELPLRGHLLCPDGHPGAGERLTGSGSTARSGAVVWYYHGQGRGAYRLPAERAHQAWVAHLERIRLAPRVASLLRTLADERGAAGTEARRRRFAAAEAATAAAEARLLDIDTRYLDGDIDRESRDRLLAHVRTARDAARDAVAEAARPSSEPDHLRYAVDVLERLPAVWSAATPEARDALTGSMWPSGVVFDGGSYRTASGDDLIGLLMGVRGENRDGRATVAGDRPIQRPGQDSNLESTA